MLQATSKGLFITCRRRCESTSPLPHEAGIIKASEFQFLNSEERCLLAQMGLSSKVTQIMGGRLACGGAALQTWLRRGHAARREPERLRQDRLLHSQRRKQPLTTP